MRINNSNSCSVTGKIRSDFKKLHSSFITGNLISFVQVIHNSDFKVIQIRKRKPTKISCNKIHFFKKLAYLFLSVHALREENGALKIKKKRFDFLHIIELISFINLCLTWQFNKLNIITWVNLI